MASGRVAGAQEEEVARIEGLVWGWRFNRLNGYNVTI